jgi:hypothetical protein
LTRNTIMFAFLFLADWVSISCDLLLNWTCSKGSKGLEGLRLSSFSLRTRKALVSFQIPTLASSVYSSADSNVDFDKYGPRFLLRIL